MNLKSEIWNPKRGLLAACLLALLQAPCSLLHAVESPHYIPFQGQVTNQAGTIVADGQYSVIFNLYDQAVGGQPVWSERHVKIGVNRGMINVFLGSIAPFDRGTPSAADDVDFSQIKYLGITVDTDNLATTADPEMVPRSLIIPAFHAKNAEKLSGQNWSAFFVNGSNSPTNDPVNGFFSGGRVSAGTITATQLGTDAVTASKIQDGAVTSLKIANNAVGAAQLAANAVTGDKIAARVIGVNAPVGGLARSAAVSTGDVAFPEGTVPYANPDWTISLTTKGGPVMVFLSGTFVYGTSNGGVFINVNFKRGGAPVGTATFSGWPRMDVPPGIYMVIDVPAAGTHTYTVDAEITGTNYNFNSVRLNAVEF